MVSLFAFDDFQPGRPLVRNSLGDVGGRGVSTNRAALGLKDNQT